MSDHIAQLNDPDDGFGGWECPFCGGQIDNFVPSDPNEVADLMGAVNPVSMLALVERVRAAESAVERVRALAYQFAKDDAEPTDEHRIGRPILDALDGPFDEQITRPSGGA